jgi:putative transposase
MLTWARRSGIALRLIEPGKPNQNAYVESFNGRLRDECLNVMQFIFMDDAREKIESWRIDYNDCRPHSSLGYPSPSEFAQQRQDNGLQRQRLSN